MVSVDQTQLILTCCEAVIREIVPILRGDGSVSPMVYPPEGSVPNLLGCLDPWDLVYHHADGHHGAFAIPVSVSGASQIISYEANKPASRLTLWGVVESRHDIANVPSPPLPQGIVGDPSHKFCSIVAV